jgi:hypothetical protein
MIPRPDRSDADEYYFTYINQVPEGDIRQILRAQLGDTLSLLSGVTEDHSLHRYAPGKWTLRQVLSHITDTERVFTFRALWFARGFDTPLASFDQDVAIASAGADGRAWASHVEEFRAVRQASLALFDSLDDAAWRRRGVASGKPVSVRGLAFITAGHVFHHARIMRERYGVQGVSGLSPGRPAAS